MAVLAAAAAAQAAIPLQLSTSQKAGEQQQVAPARNIMMNTRPKRARPGSATGPSKRAIPTSIPAISCPTDPAHTVPLTPGDDLTQVAAALGYTYRLPPGQYTISATINTTLADVTTCYRGTGQHRGDVVIKVKVLNGTEGPIPLGPRAFYSDSGHLGLFNLVLDGQNSSAGISVTGFEGIASTLTTENVTLQRFLSRVPEFQFEGSAVRVGFGATTRIANTMFLHNVCIGCYGTLAVYEGAATLSQVCRLTAVLRPSTRLVPQSNTLLFPDNCCTVSIKADQCGLPRLGGTTWQVAGLPNSGGSGDCYPCPAVCDCHQQGCSRGM
jgi:hypothetical protein